MFVMPHTDLDGASALAQRLRIRVSEELPITISGGTASAVEGDTRESIVSRADAALYEAKTAGRNCIFRHTGTEIEPVAEESECLTVHQV
jgi:PleD family two-component response regulator